MDWKNKAVIITGGTTGIGKATRELLSGNGCIVYNFDIAEHGDGKGYFIKCDVRSRQEIRDAVQQVVEKEKRIDMLFANAGIHLFANMEETTDAQVDDLVSLNILGTFFTVQSVIPIMKAQKKEALY